MKHWATVAILCLPSMLIVSGCLSLGSGLSPASPQVGLDSYTLDEHTAQSVSGCHYDYRVFRPVKARSETTVILGHGFLRDQDNMIGLSRALANAGVQVVTLDFCNMRPWKGHHKRNAQDMRELAQAVGVDKDVIYAGFSAGALAAVLASDNNTRAILTLDLVDQNNLGLKAIKHLQVPMIGLSGPASGCNARGNGISIFDARPTSLHSELTEIPDASHCEFETPSNWLCELACGDDGSKSADNAETNIIVRLIVKKLTPFLSRRPG